MPQGDHIVLPTCMQLILVSWYVASMLCCHCWMFSLSDALPMQSYPSKVWFFCVAVQISACAAQLICFLPVYISTWNRWYIMAGTLAMLHPATHVICTRTHTPPTSITAPPPHPSTQPPSPHTPAHILIHPHITPPHPHTHARARLCLRSEVVVLTSVEFP